MHRVLWIVQGLLGPLFVFAGGMKLAMPLDEIAAQSGIPGPIILIVSVAELLGGLGLILPGLLRIGTGLTPLAAAGLVVIMIGATTITAVTMDVASAAFPFVTGLLAAFVAYGRARLAPHRRRSARPRQAVRASVIHQAA